MIDSKKEILFIGAGGAVAGKLLPGLAKTYDIVGIAGRRSDLAPYCIELISGELTSEHERLFGDAFSRYAFHSIIWNAVRYHPMPLIESSRGTLHLEFDLGIALPLACLRAALAHGFAGTFIMVTSGLAFGVKPSWGSYSIMKRGQVIMAHYFAKELGGRIHAKAIALGTIGDIPASTLRNVFERAIENADSDTVAYTAYGPEWKRL
ncbi:MAG: hypothetical protein Q7S95_03680 [bacterium]|nr:hypothetical protein [bacterium]